MSKSKDDQAAEKAEKRAKKALDKSNDDQAKSKSESKPKSKSKSKSKSEKKDGASDTAPAPLFSTPAAFDPALESLFSASAGAVSVNRPAFISAIPTQDVTLFDEDEKDEEEIPKNVASAIVASREALTKETKKKRKRRHETDEMENEYLSRLHEDDEKEEKPKKKKLKEAPFEKEKKAKHKKEVAENAPEVNGEPQQEDDGDKNFEDVDDEEGDEDAIEEDSDVAMDSGSEDAVTKAGDEVAKMALEPPIRHETQGAVQDDEIEKANRTVFVGNLPSSLITEKTQYKTLKQLFKPCGTIDSIRFRSVAFSDLIPRKAAYVTKALHTEQTTINAYVVFKKSESARAAQTLNGSVVLDRHIRVDSVAHPAKQDAKRCVFVGNLDFEASEESLWKHFAKCGKVDNVRIVRDPKTNVGKGIAYVQFEEPMSVDQALLVDGQKMEDKHKRKLRVTRSKTLKKRDRPQPARPAISTGKAPREGAGFYVPKADPKKAGILGRAGKLLGRAGAAKMKQPGTGGAIFEGTRATAGMDSGVRKGGTGKKKGKPRARAAARSSAWKKNPKKAEK